MATYDDPRILRAVAHPTRNRILAELHAAGTIRAADIARMLDVPANQASFHLRQLAKYGLVEEAPEEARDKRDRVWRLADADGIRIHSQAVRDQPGGEAAWEVFRRNAAAWGHLLVDHALAPDPDDRKVLSDASVRLTAEEANELAEELGGVVQRWRERTQGAADDAGRTTYSIYQLVQPYPGPAAGDADEDA